MMGIRQTALLYAALSYSCFSVHTRMEKGTAGTFSPGRVWLTGRLSAVPTPPWVSAGDLPSSKHSPNCLMFHKESHFFFIV